MVVTTDAGVGTTSIAPRRFDFLDGVRGWAALYVVFHHVVIHSPEYRHRSTLDFALVEVGRYGHYAVDVFIVLSGYCLMLPVVRGNKLDIVNFLRRRALRILPPYFLAVLLSLMLIAFAIGAITRTHWDLCLPVTTRDIIYHVLLLQDWFPETSARINHAFWSVGVEWKIYFLFPLLLLLRARFGMAVTAIATVVVSYLAWFLCLRMQILNPSPWGSSFYYLGLFALGMLSAQCSHRLANNRAHHRTITQVTAIFTLVTLLCALRLQTRVPLQIQSLFVGTWAAMMLFALSVGALPSPIAKLFTNRAAVALGTVGYSLYLVHAPAIQLAYVYIVKPLQVMPQWELPLLCVAGLTTSLLLTIPFYLVAERPFIRLNKKLAARDVRSPAIDVIRTSDVPALDAQSIVGALRPRSL